MSVKPIRSAMRVLEALEVIAVGAVQRALVTLAESGWIRASSDGPTRWELTSRVLAVASYAQATAGLGQLIRPLMVSLRDRTEETVVCAVSVVPTETSAVGRALLAAMDRPARARLAGHELDEAAHAALDEILERGWSLNADDALEGSTSVGVAVMSGSGVPAAAIAISAVSSRMPPEAQRRVGALLAEAVGKLRVPDR